MYVLSLICDFITAIIMIMTVYNNVISIAHLRIEYIQIEQIFINPMRGKTGSQAKSVQTELLLPQFV